MPKGIKSKQQSFQTRQQILVVFLMYFTTGLLILARNHARRLVILK